jgi:outer membrane protein TolC
MISQTVLGSVLDNYIQQAIKSNLALQQQNFSFEKSQYALKEARGMFLPSLTLHARYSRAGGGREIDFPIGDLVNPIHQSLNQLLGQPLFPGNLPNEQIPFLRKEEHETKIRLVQPLIQPKIWYNYSIKSLMKKSENEKKKMFIRQLVADVQIAWFKYLQASEVVRLYEETQIILKENVRVSQKLVENEKATKDEIYTAQAELSDLKQKLQEAIKNQTLAAQYLNFLCNQPLETKIEVNESTNLNINNLNLEDANNAAMQNREELRMLDLAVTMADKGINIAWSDYYPTLNAVVDYGFQGEEYKFTTKEDYWMASAILEWNIFNGWQDEAKTQQAKVQKKMIESQKSELEKQLQLQVSEAYQQRKVAEAQCIAAQETQKSAREAFRIIHKKYKENMVSQIELIAAQNRKTTAEISTIICRYTVFIRQAEFEKVTAIFPIEDFITTEEN